MSKLKKLLDKKKTAKTTAAVVKIEDQENEKVEEANEFQTEVKDDEINMIQNLQQMEIEAQKKNEEPEKKENVDWSSGQIYKEVDIKQQVKNELQNEEKQKKENEEKENQKEEFKTFTQRMMERRMNISDTTKGYNMEEDQEDFVPLDISEQEYQKLQNEKKKKEEKKKPAIQRQVQQPVQASGPRKFINEAKGAKQNEPIQVVDSAFNKYLEIEQKLQKEKEEEQKNQKSKFNFRDNKKNVEEIQKSMFKSDQEKKIDEVKAHNAIFRKEPVVEEQKEKRPRFFNQKKVATEEQQKKEQEELEIQQKVKQDYIKENLGKKEVVTEVSTQKVSTSAWD